MMIRLICRLFGHMPLFIGGHVKHQASGRESKTGMTFCARCDVDLGTGP